MVSKQSMFTIATHNACHYFNQLMILSKKYQECSVFNCNQPFLYIR